MKLKSAFSYQFKNGLRLLGWTGVWAVAAIIVVPFLTKVLLGRLNTLSPGDFLPNGFLGFVLMVFLIFYSAPTYRGFQFMIQNGVGRKTYFYARFFTIFTLVFLGDLVSSLYNFLEGKISYNYPTLNLHLHIVNFYNHYFSNGFFNIVVPWLIVFLLFVCVAATCMFFGSILSLFERRFQIALIIGVPIVLIFAFIVVRGQADLQLTWIGRVLLWIIGGHSNFYHISVGHLNPYAPLFSGIVYSAILFFGTYLFNLKLKTPR